MSSSSLSPLALKASRGPKKESTSLVSSCSTTTTTKSTKTSSTSIKGKKQRKKQKQKSVSAGADDQVYWDPPQQSQIVRSIDQLRLHSPTNHGSTGALTQTRESIETAAHPAHPPLRTPSRIDQPRTIASVIPETGKTNPTEPDLRAPAEGHHDVAKDLRKRKRTNSTTTTTTTTTTMDHARSSPSSSSSSRPASRSDHQHTPPSKNTPILCQWNLRETGRLMSKFMAQKNAIPEPKYLVPEPKKPRSRSSRPYKKSSKKASLANRSRHRLPAASSSKPSTSKPARSS
ncbi:hypothetical protein PGT21_003830 [Puccinia graminis f. sp. tritici]|uniref:Uncharacterized protein n=1 Tax=Puccinia graminis f. sp. tritici TaxID=56615 RepID=A0A5B0R0K1_PUCGR|nr:hypothetical protein PGT21_003830 [Puccinia graminis f. sp. tritici]KAA1118434.1 hypothetical protein PGTUg99_003975 [Puccinia graminis f. sp. tritici]